MSMTSSFELGCDKGDKVSPSIAATGRLWALSPPPRGRAGSARSIDCRSSGSQSARQFERVRPPAFERRQPANVLDEVLQADLDPRPHDADGAQQPAARRDLLGAEHMLDTRGCGSSPGSLSHDFIPDVVATDDVAPRSRYFFMLGPAGGAHAGGCPLVPRGHFRLYLDYSRNVRLVELDERQGPCPLSRWRFGSAS